MKKERNTIFDNLRGLCMLGVIAIHVGSMAVSAHAASPLLVLVTNILSRYSVPAFFFISGYGFPCGGGYSAAWKPWDLRSQCRSYFFSRCGCTTSACIFGPTRPG